MNRRSEVISLLVVAGFVCFVAGCPLLSPPPADPPGFVSADAGRGGALYDKWWAAAGVDAPTGDHALWATQSTNTRSGGDTWRCKECHGWDYKGAAGAYAEGSSHFTGFTGLFGTALTAQAVFDKINDDHGYSATGLAEADIWDLAKFVLEGQIDTDDILTGDAFNGDAATGLTIYTATCFACHGDDGLSIPPGADADHDEWVGKIANENPWEFQHKVRFGQPGSAMPPQFALLALGQVSDLSTYAQTLPEIAQPQGFIDASAARGGLLYDKWWAVAGVTAPTDDHALWATQSTNTRSGGDTWRCKECHGWDYKGSAGAYAEGSSHFTGFAGLFGTDISAEDAFTMIGDTHGFTTAGLADADVWDLVKFVIEGQIDTDDIIDAGGAFTGDAATGQTLYDSGIGTNVACAICHGADGLTPPPGAAADYGDFVGLIANDNPWEFQHKVRFGQPGTSMPASATGGGSTTDAGDLGAYAQSLPTAP